MRDEAVDDGRQRPSDGKSVPSEAPDGRSDSGGNDHDSCVGAVAGGGRGLLQRRKEGM